MSERAENEVWVDMHHNFAYVRIGPKANLATVNNPEHAECVRAALQAYVALESVRSANRADSFQTQAISEEKT